MVVRLLRWERCKRGGCLARAKLFVPISKAGSQPADTESNEMFGACSTLYFLAVGGLYIKIT